MIVDEHTVYRIAEEVVQRSESAHMRRCETDATGPVRRAQAALCEMDARISEIEKGRAEERGASEAMAKSNVRTVQILAALSALSTVISFVLQHWTHR